jgi:hypothetical protein
MCLNARRMSDFVLLTIIKTPWRELSYSWSRARSRGDGIENMVTLSDWECGSYLYWLQKLEVYLYPTRSEHEAKEMTWVDQRLWARSALSFGQGKCCCRRTESQGSLQLLASCTSYGRRVQHLSVAKFIIVQHHPHTHLEGWDHCCTMEWWGLVPYQEKNTRRWSKGCLFPWGCRKSPMVKG